METRHREGYQDALHLYRLSGRARTTALDQESFSQSVVLELPRWKPEWRRKGDKRGIEFVSGSWNEDVYPGALSYNATNRVTVLREAYTRGPGYDLRYVLRHDQLVDHLARYNGREVHWNVWSPSCAAVFSNRPSLEMYVLLYRHGVPVCSRTDAYHSQVCGWTVLTALRDQVHGRTEIEAADFNPAQIDARMVPGVIVPGQWPVARECGIFEGDIQTQMVYRCFPQPLRCDDCVTRFVLGSGRLFYSQVSDGVL